MDEPSSRYLIPARTHRVEESIQKSRFITTATHAPDPQAAHAFVAQMRAEHPDATHHCWAFIAGPPGSTRSIGMSDDGEPHGTAGRPMLTTLLHSRVGEIVAVCTRYFGGTKLGTGGLSRAYSGGVKLLLETLPTEELVERITLQVVVDYGSVAALQKVLEEVEAIILLRDYGENVQFRVAVPKENVAAIFETVAGATRGHGTVQPLEE